MPTLYPTLADATRAYFCTKAGVGFSDPRSLAELMLVEFKKITPVGNPQTFDDWQYEYYSNKAAASNPGALLRTNLTKYPNAEDGTITGWFSGATGVVTNTTEQAHSNTRSYKVVCPGTATGEGINQNPSAGLVSSGTTNLETVSAWVLAPAGATLIIIAEEYTPANGYVNGASAPLTGTGTWQRGSRQFTKATAANLMRTGIRTVGMAQAITFYVDDALTEASSTLNDYFDGSSATDASQVASWTGTPNASTSELRVAGVLSTYARDIDFLMRQYFLAQLALPASTNLSTNDLKLRMYSPYWFALYSQFA